MRYEPAQASGGWQEMIPSDKLRAYWSRRERDVMLAFPMGQGTKCDAHWLSGVFNEEFTKELAKRGYDPTTLRFWVEPAKGNAKFASQRTDPTP